ncbi:MAG: hypothetical protein FJW91_02615 [Actinobacteria bacterium]|nr:hypothetical protein [Actinomycetota bacterium]
MEASLLREIVEIAGENTLHRILLKTQAAARRLVPNKKVEFTSDNYAVVIETNLDGFNENERMFIEIIAQAATLSLDNSLNNDLANRLQINEERLRIARDLHDRVLQRIFATGITLEGALRKAIVTDVIEALKQAIVDLDETVGEIRTTVNSLKGPQGSLRQQILREIERARLAWEMVIDFQVGGPIDTMVNRDKFDDILSVTTELLNNCGKHGKGEGVKYSLVVDGSELEISVTNSGMSTREFRFGSGLENCSYRATKYGGKFVVNNLEPGLQTIWKIPL